MRNKSLLTALMTVLCFFLVAQIARGGMNVRKDCLINQGPCVKEIAIEGIKVVFDINPKPVSPMKDIVFEVTLTDRSG
ncbi:MAG: hypothetical protein AB1499_13405, partial [Nitrospirota bacterium]